MDSIKISPWLIRFSVIILLPTVSCFGYYSIGDLEQPGSLVILLLIIAYPLTIIGFIGLLHSLQSPENSKLKHMLWLLCIILPLAIIIGFRA